MTLVIDTDVLVHWAMAGAPFHNTARRLVEAEVRGGRALGLVPQVLFELVHVITDQRRFARPLTIRQATALAGELWDSPDVVHVLPVAHVVGRVTELMERFRLGRQRILDTALAATIEAAGLRRIATFNRADYAIFTFLEIVDPNEA